MGYKWIRTNYPGVRYREHATRKHGVNLDRYFSIYYRLNGKQREEGIGWGSDGWNVKKAAIILSDLKKNHLTGEGPQTLSEKRDLGNEKRENVKREKLRLEKENTTFEQYFNESYIPIAKTNKKAESFRKEAEHFKNWLGPVLKDRPLKKSILFILSGSKAICSKPGGPRVQFNIPWQLSARSGIWRGVMAL